MTPCTVPSLASASTAAPATACGCASSQPVEEGVFAQIPVREHQEIPDRLVLYFPGPVPQAPPVELSISCLLLVWLIVGTIVARSQRRSVVLQLGLAGPPAFFSAPRSRPKLVLSERERRAIRSASEILARFPSVSRPSPAAAYALAYSQPRRRNQVSMPPATTMQTAQKIG